MRSISLMLTFCCLMLVSFAQRTNMADPNSMELKPFYIGNDKSAYYLSQNGDEVFWAAEHFGKQYAHVFHGTKKGNIIEGKWWSVTKYKLKAYGSVQLKMLKGGDELKVVQQTGKFPTQSLKVNRIEHFVDQLPQQKSRPAYSSSDNLRLTGAFRGKDKPIVLYSREVGTHVIFFGESKFRKGEKPHRAFVFVGSRGRRGMIHGTLAYLPKGTMKGSGKAYFRTVNGELNQVVQRSNANAISIGEKNWTRVFPKPSSSSGNPVAGASGGKLPTTPKYVELQRNNYYAVLDFTRTVDGFPSITLPEENLPQLLVHDNKLVFPDNFCGLRIRKPARYYWMDQSGNIINNANYNSMPEGKYLEDVNFERWYDGIEFTGAIGYCANKNEEWKFPQPLTTSGKLAINDTYHGKVKLVIETLNGSEIEFLNYHLKSPKPLKTFELYKDFKDMTMKNFTATADPHLEAFMKDYCKAFPKDCKEGSDYCGAFPFFCEKYQLDNK